MCSSRSARHFEHLLTIITGKELTGGGVFAIVNAEVELFAEGDLALPAFELARPDFNGHVLIPYVVFHQGQVMRGEGALVAVVAVTDVVVVDEGVQLVVRGRHATVGLLTGGGGGSEGRETLRISDGLF